MFDNIDTLAVNTIRTLSISQIENANSGHPGLPMGASPMAYCLWNKFLKVNPKNSSWVDRDRFVLSAGHGSAMLYSLLHLSGYDLSIDDLKNFRQLGSKTPGHPERMHTDGVEVTTGPLGQGIANAVGIAMAERHLAATYNKDGFDIVNHYTYAICGDGDLMEGISSEALSLAGHLKLSKLILLYDSNNISLDGPLNKSFTEDIKKRFEAYNWSYLRVEDGNDLSDLYEKIELAKKDTDRPTVIEVKTIIGYGSKNQGTNKVHGAPIGKDDYLNVKNIYNWKYDDFEVPKEVYERFSENIIKNGKEANERWDNLFKEYEKEYPKLAKAFKDGFERKFDEELKEKIKKYTSNDKPIATRSSSGQIIQDISKNDINFWGGSADLSSSNKTMISESEDFSSENYKGSNIWYGVREFAMGAIANGIMAHGGTNTYVSTFFVFSDYLRGAIRLAALSKLPVTYVFTHDSVAVGEDGPTHEPIEQLASFRAVSNLNVIRPADANEVRQAWIVALKSKQTPNMIVLSRQNLRNLKETEDNESLEKGAYIISDFETSKKDGILIATGSEVSIALDAKELLAKEGIDVRVVSMPSFELFRNQSMEYKEEVLPKDIKNRVSIEAASTFGWKEFVGDNGISIGIDRFGMSGNGNKVLEELGFTAENIKDQYIKNFK
ncbi:MAG: transketolase [Tissierellia bacterium]|nr:transketolase [Tissierellia bacterium]